MFDQQPTLELFFEQLGLDASAEAIDRFIETHQLTMDIPLHKAPFWTAMSIDHALPFHHPALNALYQGELRRSLGKRRIGSAFVFDTVASLRH